MIMASAIAPTTDRPATPPLAAFPVANSRCLVRENRVVNQRYRHLMLEAPVPLCTAQPGQFVHLLCPPTREDEPFLRRPMSVYRASRETGYLEFLYNVVGTGTRALAALRPGDSMMAMGPLGNGFTVLPEFRHVLVVARGVGFATLAPLVPQAARGGSRITALLSARSPADLMQAEFEQGEVLRIHPVFDSDGSSEVSRVDALIRGILAADRPDAVFTCGSNRLLVLLQKLCMESGIPGQVALEQQMACALGVCLCCVRALHSPGGGIEHRRVCCEGPVFDLQAVVQSASGR